MFICFNIINYLILELPEISNIYTRLFPPSTIAKIPLTCCVIPVGLSNFPASLPFEPNLFFKVKE